MIVGRSASRGLSDDSTLVISAEHGLLELDTILDPYDQSLANIQRKDFKEWLEMVSQQIKEIIPTNSSLYFHTGKRFRRLIDYLPEYSCQEPTKGMDIGKQLKYFKEKSLEGGEYNDYK